MRSTCPAILFTATGTTPSRQQRKFLVKKQIDLVIYGQALREIRPRLSRVAVLWNVDNPYSMLVFKITQGAGRTMGIEVRSLDVRGPDDFDTAFEAARG